MRYTLFCNNCGSEDFDTFPAPGHENYIYTCTTCGRHIILADTQDIVLKAELIQDDEGHDELYDYDIDELSLDDDDGVMDGACDE